MTKLNDHEGTFLSLVLRIQPTTAYQVAKVYEQSPVTNYKTHKGKIYPIIDRLVERGWLEKKAVRLGRRLIDQLICTESGREAVRDWVQSIRPEHLLLDDPLRTRVQSFGLLTQKEQIDWAVNAREHLQGKLAELEAYRNEAVGPFQTLVHDNAVRVMRARMDWVEIMIADIVAGPESGSSAN